MPEKPVTYAMPNGQIVNGFDVPVNQTTERWTDVDLEDGTTLRIKTTVLSVIRQKDQWDPEGNPVYIIKSVPALTIVSSPDKLKRRVQ